MDAAERALLETTVQDALERVAREPASKVDAVLAELGWPEMFRAEPRDAVDVVFTALGATNAAATVLDTWGRVDLLVNNAIAHVHGGHERLLAQDLGVAERMVRADLTRKISEDLASVTVPREKASPK